MTISVENILFLLKTIQIKDILDIFIVATFLSFVIYIFLQTRSYKLVVGIIILAIVYFLSNWLNLVITKSFFQEIFKILPIVLIIVFHKEIRLFLIRIGFLFDRVNRFRFLKGEKIINELLEFFKESQRLKIGNILVFENYTPLESYLRQKTEINADLSSELLLTIFNKNAPLHDGAVIIKKDKIKYAAAILPLAEEQPSLNLKKGTRHRAALGITEESDSFAIVVSEEDGTISLAEKGEIKFNLSLDEIKKILEKYYYQGKEGSIQIYFDFSFVIKFLVIFFTYVFFFNKLLGDK
jgi:diadenylate cyclase